MMKRRTALLSALAAGVSATSPAWGAPAAAKDNNTLRVVPFAGLSVLDPIWTSAYNTRNHGYMIYDTLFGTDEEGNVKPQMVDAWTMFADQKTWVFTLRDGLFFHDGKPVTSTDVTASLTRWSSRDALGGLLARNLDGYDALDAKSFRMRFKESFGFVLEALGKPSSNVPFIMPARIAATSAMEQIKEHIGSGPFVFAASEFQVGTKIVYLKNKKYVPRKEAASGTAGGKNVFVDRVEWVAIPDPQMQINALLANEVDIIEQPIPEHYRTIRITPKVHLADVQPAGFQLSLRLNFLHPPFDNVLVRRAAMLAVGQEQVLRTQVAALGMYRFCKSLFPCGTYYESEHTGNFRGEVNLKLAKKLLDEAGYKGEPVVLMRPTDIAALSKAPIVVKEQWERAGFKVDMLSMDFKALIARRAKQDAPAQGGWNAFITYSAAADNLNPITMSMMNAKGRSGWFGWQDDPELEKIKMDFVRARDGAERRRLADAAQLRAIDQVTHVNLGQFNMPAAVRDSVSGLVPGGAQVYWNVRKT